MPSLKVAHVRQQGVDMVIVPLDATFDQKTPAQRQAAVAEIQSVSLRAGLRGTVVPMWPSGGRTKFIAPNPWRPFFSRLPLHRVMASLNRTLEW